MSSTVHGTSKGVTRKVMTTVLSKDLSIFLNVKHERGRRQLKRLIHVCVCLLLLLLANWASTGYVAS